MGKYITRKIKYNLYMKYMKTNDISIIKINVCLNYGYCTTSEKLINTLEYWGNKEIDLRNQELNKIDKLNSERVIKFEKKRERERDQLRKSNKEDKYRIKWKDYSREQLEEMLEIQDMFIKEIKEDKKKKKFQSIKRATLIFKNIPIVTLCKLFRVSKSGYYKWLKNGSMMNNKMDKSLMTIITEVYYDRRKNCGYRRIVDILNIDMHINTSEHTVRRYMKHLGLKVHNPKNYRKVRENKDTKVNILNIIARNFKANEPNEKWYIDVTQIETNYGPLYCSAIIDGYNNELIDLKIFNHQELSLTLANVNSAIKKNKINNLIIHSDHAMCYSSNEFIKLIKKYNITQSMSRVGNSLDNRPIEFFFKILKHEYLRLIPLKERTLQRLNKEIEFIMYDYNYVRRQRCLNKLMPYQYRLNNQN